MRDTIIVLLVALIIVVGGWKFLNYQNSLSTEPANTNTEDNLEVKLETASTTSEVVPSADKASTATAAIANVVDTVAVKVASDTKAGSAVTIASVTLPASGWVAIRDYQNEKMGNTLGAKLFAAGTSSGTIELLRPLVSGSTYVAVPLKDNGDGAYKGSDDLPFAGIKIGDFAFKVQ